MDFPFLVEGKTVSKAGTGGDTFLQVVLCRLTFSRDGI